MGHDIKDEEIEMKQFSKGETVTNRYGERLTVICQRGCQVFTSNGGWVHPSNLRRGK
jgi:hypothetical protein